MVFNGHAADPVVTRLVEEDKVRWWNKPNLRRLYLILFLCCMGVEMTSGFDSQLINTLQIAPAFLIYFGNGYRDSVGPNIEPAMLGFLGSCYQLGSVFAVPLAPYLNDRFGRRWTVMTGSIIMIVGALLQGFAQHIAMYVIARMLLGVGILFAIIAGSSLIGELSHPKERPTMTSFFNSTYFIGATVASAITLATVDIPNDWAWRVPSLLQIVPSLLQVTFIMFLPESPRWLVSKDRDDEAFAVLTKYHAEGDANSLLVQAEMAQIKSTIKLELEHAKQSWWDMVATPGMRRRFLIAVFLGLFTQMSGNTLLSSYGSLMMNQMGYTTTFAKTRITVAKNCWGFINANLIAIFVVKFPRRIAFMTSSTTMLLVFIGMTITFWALGDASAHKTTNSSAGVAALFFYFAYDPCYNIGNNSLTYTYLIELFPYAVRTRGISVEQFFGKLAGFFSTNVNPIALTAISWKFLAAYCGWIACEFFVQFFLYPETHGRTLEELAFLFEDDALNQQTTAAVEKQIHSADAPLHQAATIEEAHAKA